MDSNHETRLKAGVLPLHHPGRNRRLMLRPDGPCRGRPLPDFLVVGGEDAVFEETAEIHRDRVRDVLVGAVGELARRHAEYEGLGPFDDLHVSDPTQLSNVTVTNALSLSSLRKWTRISVISIPGSSQTASSTPSTDRPPASAPPPRPPHGGAKPNTDAPEPDISAPRRPALASSSFAWRTAGTWPRTASSRRLKSRPSHSGSGRPPASRFSSLASWARRVNTSGLEGKTSR